ncbi:hypothetical protein HNW13_000125 [Shewanella sp. BF02_Schw]|uniref:hypothetical protein n=1 Tax=Shewanella sp. BF02_Schw TaxID=394908 RepID=UPI001784B388|nr:hypothetical protein [Shewanella sp. BF02_Schw]MBO1894211.1 hypothetical protein [Shewanella sp. BF02_Schw]
MDLKDLIPIVLSALALLLSAMTWFLAYFHRRSKAILCYVKREFGVDDNGSLCKRELTYSFSNTGEQSLYVKVVNLLVGESPLGPLRHSSSYNIIQTNIIQPFISNPGQIETFTLIHDLGDKRLPDDDDKDKFTIVQVVVISANGKRYEMSHDISKLGPVGPEAKDLIWKSASLGKCKYN